MLSQNDVNFIRDALVLKVNTILSNIVSSDTEQPKNEEKPKETKKKGDVK